MNDGDDQVVELIENEMSYGSEGGFMVSFRE